jgi:16S rRNA processing protein RimM
MASPRHRALSPRGRGWREAPGEGEKQHRITLGVVTGAHGIRGEVKLKSFTEEPQAIAEYGPLERSDGGGSLDIESLRPSKDGLIARFAGIADRNAAEELKGVELSLTRNRLPQPETGAFYQSDLIGLAVEQRDGGRLGEVVAVHNYGAGDLIEVKLAEGGRTVLLPFTEAVVPLVEPERGRLVADPPEGLIEE